MGGRKKNVKTIRITVFSRFDTSDLALNVQHFCYIIIIIINGISNAHNHRNVPCSMRYIHYYNLKSLNIHIKINNG